MGSATVGRTFLRRGARHDEGGRARTGIPVFRNFFSIFETYFLACLRAIMINHQRPGSMRASCGRLVSQDPEPGAAPAGRVRVTLHSGDHGIPRRAIRPGPMPGALEQRARELDRSNRRRGEAPRGERPALWGAGRLVWVSYACRVMARVKVRRSAPAVLGASLPQMDEA